MHILLTGAAGFIGSHVARALVQRGDQVVGIDNLSDYYDVGLKEARLRDLLGVGTGGENSRFEFQRLDIADRVGVDELFSSHPFQGVVHLAAQPGVRHSIHHPHDYVTSNMMGFLNILEGCRHSGIGHLVYASSSSIYGANQRLPFSVQHNVDHPLSLYAASKKSNELMAHAYAHLFGIPATGLRFFTVYGPWGRPDMAPMKFASAMLAGEPIDVYHHGQHTRDFTYIDDIVESVLRSLDRPARPNPDWDAANPDPASSSAPWRLHNIGNQHPVRLMNFIEALEEALGLEARKNFMPMQHGDVPDTFADVSSLVEEIGYSPSTPLREGIGRFAAWYLEYYGTKIPEPQERPG